MKKLLIKSCGKCPFKGAGIVGWSCYLSNKTITQAKSLDKWAHKHVFPIWCELPDDDSEIAWDILTRIQEKTEGSNVGAFKTGLIRWIKNTYLGRIEKRGKNKKVVADK